MPDLISILLYLGTLIEVIAAVVVVAILFGIFRAVARWAYNAMLHKLNKRHGKSYIILSGSPELVSEMYDVCLRVVNIVQQKQQQPPEERIPVNNGRKES